ncbi:MAG TPA: FG-GAP-like repeat-containing protein [Bryobacteraceae bacterium]|nr:FG-GAP-like repeat-containing protein [Bryobacteraceae bacterium]
MKRTSRLPIQLGIGCTILALFAHASLHAQAVFFIQQNQVAVGSNPSSLAIANFSGGGKADLAVANQGSSTLTLLRGLGNGFFQPLPTQKTGLSPRAVVTGDFNLDGRTDLAVADFAANSVSILLGNGNGTFRLMASLNAAGPASIVVGDFNSDGIPDLAVAESNSNKVSIFIGIGNGVFQRFFSMAVGNGPASIITDDFNGDGVPDLAVANTSSNNVSILLGLGDATFRPPLNFEAGSLPAYLVSGDFNGDGQTDLAVVNATGSATSSVTILLGLGNGFFHGFINPTAGANASFLVAGDFNLDGVLDLAVANTGSNTISIYIGFGDGTFQPRRDFVAGSAPDWIGVTDLNGDGKPDLLVANSRSNTVSVLINHTSTPIPPSVTSVVNGGSLQGGPVAPGELVTIFGSNLGPDTPVQYQLTASGLVPSQLAQTQALFDGIPAPLLSVAAGQVSAVVPFEVAGNPSTQLVVQNGDQISAMMTLPVTDSAPALLSADGSGQGQGMITNADGSPNSAANPAAGGSVVVLYATGAGQTNPPGVDGLPGGDVLPIPLLQVSVTIGGVPAPMASAAGAPGLVAGIVQVSVQLPDGVSGGVFPVVLQVGNATSQPGVTLAVQ